MIELKSVTKKYKSLKTGSITTLFSKANLVISDGEAWGLIGRSGSGKSTLARIMLGIIEPDAGHVLWNGVDITRFSRTERKNFHRQVQFV